MKHFAQTSFSWRLFSQEFDDWKSEPIQYSDSWFWYIFEDVSTTSSSGQILAHSSGSENFLCRTSSSRAQSFTSLVADNHQDINIVSSFRKCLNGTFPWRNCINPNKKSNRYKSSLLSYLTKALTEHFLQGNVPLRHLLNAKPPFILETKNSSHFL